MLQMKAGFDATGDNSLGVEYAQMLQQSGEISKARGIYEQILEKSPGQAMARNNLAMLLVNNNPDKAALDKALELAMPLELSNNPIFLDTLGWVQFKRNELTKAVKVLERAAGLMGEREIAEVNYHLAEAYAAIDKKPAAVKLLEQVVASNQQFEGKDRAQALLESLR